MILLPFYYVKCQTWFVQVSLLIMEAGARSLWCGSFQYAGIVSKAPLRSWHGSFPVRARFSGQETISTRALTEMQAELLVNLSCSFGPELPV